MKNVNLNKLANDLEWNRKTWSWSFLICLCDNHFRSFLSVLGNLTATSISSLTNSKRTYFYFYPESRQWLYIRIFHLFLLPNFIKLLSASIVGPKFETRSIPNSIFKTRVFSLLWIPNFIKIRLYLKGGNKSAQIWNFGPSVEFQRTYTELTYSILVLSVKIRKHCGYSNFGTKFAQGFNFGSWPAISKIIFMINQLDLLWMPNLIALGIYFILGTKFSWMMGLIVVLMSNVCYLAIILIFLVVIW